MVPDWIALVMDRKVTDRLTNSLNQTNQSVMVGRQTDIMVYKNRLRHINFNLAKEYREPG